MELYSERVVAQLHESIMERLGRCGLRHADLIAVKAVIKDVLVGRAPERGSHRANFVTKYLPAASSQVMVLSTDEEADFIAPEKSGRIRADELFSKVKEITLLASVRNELEKRSAFLGQTILK